MQSKHSVARLRNHAVKSASDHVLVVNNLILGWKEQTLANAIFTKNRHLTSILVTNRSSDILNLHYSPRELKINAQLVFNLQII